MTHPNEEEMVDAYYAGVRSELQKHLIVCQECSILYRRICETLETASVAQLPERGAGYGAQVWARVSAQLQVKSETRAWPRKQWQRWLLVPAVAAGLGLVFAGGMWTERLSREVSAVEVTFIHGPVANPIEGHIEIPKIKRLRSTSKPQKARTVSDGVQDARLLALNSLLETDAKTALPEVLEMIKGDTSDKTKEHALFVLAQSNSAEAREAVMDMARDSSNPGLQTRAVRMMGMMGGDGTRKELVGLYRSSSSQALKREILNGLMFSGSKTTLLKVAKTEPDPELRNSAMANLSITGMEDGVTVFALAGAPKAQKTQILTSVFLAGDSQVLLDVLRKQPDAGMRVATIRSLAVMGERSKVLTNVYRTDHDEEVRRAVLDALVVQQNGDALSELARGETDVQRKAEILSRLATIRAQETFK